MQRVTLLLGSNIGDRHAVMEAARGLIGDRIGDIAGLSPLHESEPWGFDSPNTFINQAIVVDTDLPPFELLDSIQAIENELGRERYETVDNSGMRVYRDRTIDIDILYYGEESIQTDRLTIPHPRIEERDFVLIPLRAINYFG